MVIEVWEVMLKAPSSPQSPRRANALNQWLEGCGCSSEWGLWQVIDWLRSGSRTLRTRFEPEPNQGFRVRSSKSPNLNPTEMFGFDHSLNPNLWFEP